MGKKKFEDQIYNPLEQDLLRDAAKVGREAFAPPAQRPAAPREVAPPKVLDLPSQPAIRPELRERARSRSEVPESERGVAPQRSSRFIAKRFELTREEDVEFGAFLARVQKACGVRVPVSVLIRACCTLLQQGEAALVAELRRGPFRSIPSTGDDLGYAQFEERWVDLVRSAIKKTTREASQGIG